MSTPNMEKVAYAVGYLRALNNAGMLKAGQALQAGMIPKMRMAQLSKLPVTERPKAYYGQQAMDAYHTNTGQRSKADPRRNPINAAVTGSERGYRAGDRLRRFMTGK